MKTLKFLTLVFLSALCFTSCSSDDDNTPDPINPPEVITTMIVTLTPSGGGLPITLQFEDLDGDGPDAPVITPSSASLAANTTYAGTIMLLNKNLEETDDEYDVTLEVEEENDEHQFFYTIENGLNITAEATNNDDDGNPLGTKFELITTDASSGTLTFTLRHEPKKPNDGSLDDAGGETDITATFDLEVANTAVALSPL